MELGSLPYPEELATGTYPKPDEHSQNPHPIPTQSTSPSYFSQFHFIFFSHLYLGLPRGLFPSGFPTKALHELLSFQYMLYALPISHSMA
jgi:hypothetical protein